MPVMKLINSLDIADDVIVRQVDRNLTVLWSEKRLLEKQEKEEKMWEKSHTCWGRAIWC
jgi:hypothetical protein